jgi:hypothetical protein
MAKRKGQNTTQKLKIEQHEPHCELRCSRRVSISCSTSDTRRVTLITIHAIGKDRGVLTTSGAHPWSSVTQIFRSGQPSHGERP